MEKKHKKEIIFQFFIFSRLFSKAQYFFPPIKELIIKIYKQSIKV
jgi:hypothetical protein